MASARSIMVNWKKFAYGLSAPAQKVQRFFETLHQSGAVKGNPVYGIAERTPPTPPAAPRFTLSPARGPPGLLIETDTGLVPVELKSGACPRSGPHAAHVAQLMTYCVLVEDAFARPVSYGVLQYSDAQRQIPYTADRKSEILQLADEIRTQARLFQRAKATSTRWPLSEVRLPACVRRCAGLTAPEPAGYNPMGRILLATLCRRSGEP